MAPMLSRFHDPDFLARVKPVTLARYKLHLLAFTTFCTLHRLSPQTPEDWDGETTMPPRPELRALPA